jgi:type IV secretory pathway TrbF-like protein
MTRLFTLLLLSALAGCGASVKASSARSVVIHATGVGSAQALADTECAKHSRHAQFSRQLERFVFTFDCVV